MTSYEWGADAAPEGAPVRWRERTPGNDFIIEFDMVGTTRGFAATFHTMGNASDVSDAICRAFHVEALARAYMASDTFDDAVERRAALFEALR